MNLNKTIPVQSAAPVWRGAIRRGSLMAVLLLGSWLVSLAQTADSPQAARKRSVYMELFGASDLVGISFESRDTPFSARWGYRIGISYYGNGRVSSGVSDVKNGFGIPLEVNYLIGKMEKRSKFEVGLGVNLGGHKQEYWHYYIEGKEWIADQFDQDILKYASDNYAVSRKFRFTSYLFATIGYRFQAWNGFQLRAGITPSVGLTDANTKKGISVCPYLSLGYAF